MERIVLLRSCHSLTPTASTASSLPSEGDELHVTISVASSDNISGTPHRTVSTTTAASEPFAELDGSSMSRTRTIKIPLSEYNGRVTIEDVATSGLFHPTDEVSIFCVLFSKGVASSSPMFSAYARVENFKQSVHTDVQVVQHVGLRLSGDSVGVCMTLAKAPTSSERAIEGALATEHLQCYADHVGFWQLEKALNTKNAAVDELIQSDILLSDEIKRQRNTISHHSPTNAVVGSSSDEVTQLRAKVKELELERVKELEAMRRLIAERRADREAHIETRLKESKPIASGSARPSATGSVRPAGAVTSSSSRLTPIRASTPQRGSSASTRTGVTTPLRGAAPPPAPTGTRTATPTRGGTTPIASSTARTQRSATPTRGGVADPRRTSVSTPIAKSPAGRSITSAPAATAVPTTQASMLKRAEDNLMRLRGDAPSRPTTATSQACRVNSSAVRQSPSLAARTMSPLPSRGVPPPPPDIRSSPMRTLNSANTPTAAGGVRRTGVGASNSTPTRCSTPTQSKQQNSALGSKASPLMRNNTQSLIRMAKQ